MECIGTRCKEVSETTSIGNIPLIGIAIVVKRPNPIPVSMRPEIEDPIIASREESTVAGPYMYLTVTSSMRNMLA